MFEVSLLHFAMALHVFDGLDATLRHKSVVSRVPIEDTSF